MKLRLSTMIRHWSAAAALLSALSASGAAVAAPGVPCADFVYLEDGQFKVDGEPYQMKGVNFPMVISAVPIQGQGGTTYEYFLAPFNGNRPDNNAICTPFSDPLGLTCCSDATSCAAFVQQDIDALHEPGFNSVRLLFSVAWDTGFSPHRPYYRVMEVGREWWDPPHKLYLDDPVSRTVALDMIEQQINWLGAEGIRTVLLTGSFDAGEPTSQPAYEDWLGAVAQRLANNPHLIAYDPQNEPVYEYKQNPGATKSVANAMSRGWFDALTHQDSRHFVSVGLAGANSVFDWDPQVLWDHFTSYHVYTTADWDGPVPGRHRAEGDIHYAALNECGLPCPFKGEHDGANCLVAEGPVGTVGAAVGGGFMYSMPSGATTCPIGTYVWPGCLIDTYVPQRDVPFTLQQTLYYVVAQNGTCPPGASYDGANCILHTAPPGANAFLWTSPQGQTGYYYQYLSAQEHCHAPAVDDGASCYLGPVPAGWQPFMMDRPLFYVKAAQCGPKKPVYFGETGFSVAPYPGGSADFWDNPPATVPPELDAVKDRCENEVNKPVIDRVQVGAVTVEAETGALSGNAQVESCSGCSGAGVALRTGSAVTLNVGAHSACQKAKIFLRAPQSGGTSLKISVDGKPGRTFKVPQTQGVGMWVRSFDFSIAGADTITIEVPYREHGGWNQQVEYVGGGNGFDGIGPYSHACGFQGMHWWAYGSNSFWGCEDFALNQYWYAVDPGLNPAPNSPDELQYLPVMETLRDDVDYLAAPPGKCEKPPTFHQPLSPEVSATPRFTYNGRVKSGTAGVAYAAVRGRSEECGLWDTFLIPTFADENGYYTIRSEFPLVEVTATHFGHSVKTINPAAASPGSTTTLPEIQIQPVPTLVPSQSDLNVPSTPATACHIDGRWVVL